MAKKKDEGRRFLDIADDIDRELDGERFVNYVFIAVTPDERNRYYFNYRIVTDNPGALDRYVLEALDALEYDTESEPEEEPDDDE
jgi:hypothetical protein